MPKIPLVSPRSFITTIYHIDQEDGDFIFISSAKGNANLRDKYKAVLLDDVIADLEINMMKFSPKYDASGEQIGTEFSQVISLNPNGDLPDMLKTRLVQAQSSAILAITEDIRKQSLSAK